MPVLRATRPRLAVGDNIIAVMVTAGDGITRRTYTVTVTRAAAPAVTVSFGQASYTAARGRGPRRR